jgi:elongation factor G
MTTARPSSFADESDSQTQQEESAELQEEVQRLQNLRVVGIFAHVDAGKTTITERMLALAGVVRRAGSVDDGDTVTDFLPAERERGITIQSAAVLIPWTKSNSPQVPVTISLIDTPGHVDFSVEVNRSVAVLDGAVLVVDSVAGVQAQTETVWRAMNKPSLNNHDPHALDGGVRVPSPYQDHSHEPLPCVAVVNKMDKDGCNFAAAMESLSDKLPGANPLAIHLPLFRHRVRRASSSAKDCAIIPGNIVASLEGEPNAEFCGVVDVVRMRATIWPDLAASNGFVSSVQDCSPDIIDLLVPGTREPYDSQCAVTKRAQEVRHRLWEALAGVDQILEEMYMDDREPSADEMGDSLRRAVLSHEVLPVLAAAALRGMGVEPILDAVSDLLPCPLDRLSPALTVHRKEGLPSPPSSILQRTAAIRNGTCSISSESHRPQHLNLGHALHPDLLALAFKVVHLKGKGSGDGRVVFCRIYSGQIREGQVVSVASPSVPGEAISPARPERVGGILELAGGRFAKLESGSCRSGGVCALIGLKSVVTGDTLSIQSAAQGRKSKKKSVETVCLAGVSSPKPVLTVRLEAETTHDQARVSEALSLLSIEDPSLKVEETESTTLLSGLGELHIEVTLDRLLREYGLQNIRVGPPSVTYRETVTVDLETDGLVAYDRSVGGTRLQGSVHLALRPITGFNDSCDDPSVLGCSPFIEPTVTIGPLARDYLELDPHASEEDLALQSPVAKALIQGVQGALTRGPLGSYALANVTCCVVNVDAEDGVRSLQSMPGALRAAAAHAVTKLMTSNRNNCGVLEPVMLVEVHLPSDLVGIILSDLTSRRGTVDEVVVGEGDLSSSSRRSLIRAQVPLVEILGYANALRSLTGGEGSFTAEYKGHAPGPVR